MQRQSMYTRSLWAMIALVLIMVLWPQPAHAQAGFDCTYTVQGGDSLIAIANRHGVKNYRDIVSASGLASDVIHPGDVLNVPCPNAVPSPTPTQVSIAPVQNPQNTPVSGAPQDCGGCRQAALPYNWSQISNGVDGMVIMVALVEPTPLGEGVIVVSEVMQGGKIIGRIYKIAVAAAVTLGPALSTLLPTTGIQPTAQATVPSLPLSPEEAQALESKKELTKEEQEAIQARAQQVKKEDSKRCMRGVSQQEVEAATLLMPVNPQLLAEVMASVNAGKYAVVYRTDNGIGSPPFEESSTAHASGLTPNGRYDVGLFCRNALWLPIHGGAGFTKYPPKSAPAVAPAQPTLAPPTATPMPLPPTETSVPPKPTPIIATPTPSGCGALVVDGAQIVASASHGQSADQKDADGKVIRRWWCNAGTWQ